MVVMGGVCDRGWDKQARIFAGRLMWYDPCPATSTLIDRLRKKQAQQERSNLSSVIVSDDEHLYEQIDPNKLNIPVEITLASYQLVVQKRIWWYASMLHYSWACKFVCRLADAAVMDACIGPGQNKFTVYIHAHVLCMHAHTCKQAAKHFVQR